MFIKVPGNAFSSRIFSSDFLSDKLAVYSSLKFNRFCLVCCFTWMPMLDSTFYGSADILKFLKRHSGVKMFSLEMSS